MLRVPLFLLVSTALGLAGCKKDEEKNPASPTGTWRLTNRSCYCAAAPTPNEKLVLTATNFYFYKDDTLAVTGTYTPATFTQCGAATVSGLRFTASKGPWITREAVPTITGNNLVLDYGGPCDAPVDTYEPVP